MDMTNCCIYTDIVTISLDFQLQLFKYWYHTHANIESKTFSLVISTMQVSLITKLATGHSLASD